MFPIQQYSDWRKFSWIVGDNGFISTFNNVDSFFKYWFKFPSEQRQQRQQYHHKQ